MHVRVYLCLQGLASVASQGAEAHKLSLWLVRNVRFSNYFCSFWVVGWSDYRYTPEHRFWTIICAVLDSFIVNGCDVNFMRRNLTCSHTFVTSGSKTTILYVNDIKGTYKYINKSIVTSRNMWLLRAIEIQWKIHFCWLPYTALYLRVG